MDIVVFPCFSLKKESYSNLEENTENGGKDIRLQQNGTIYHRSTMFLFVTQLGKRDVLDWATGEATRVPFHAVV